MTTFIPYIESHLTRECKQPIFARIATHHLREIQMTSAEYSAQEHLQCASMKIRLHYDSYKTSSISERFPIDRYHYFIAPELACISA